MNNLPTTGKLFATK